jgi:hypothetical protein
MLAPGFGLIVIGAVMLVSGVRNRSILDVLKGVTTAVPDAASNNVAHGQAVLASLASGVTGAGGRGRTQTPILAPSKVSGTVMMDGNPVAK